MAEQTLERVPTVPRRLELGPLLWGGAWLSLASVLTLLFLFLPITMVLLFSFSADQTTRFPIRALTLDWYAKALSNPAVLASTRNSIVVAAGTAFLSALLSTPAALALARRRGRLPAAVRTFFTLPLALPTLIIGVALLLLFSVLQFRLSLLTVIIGHTVYLLPFPFLVISARLQDMDPYLEEAARDLGASGWRTFWEVTFPLIRSSIVGAMFLVFAQSFDMFVITFLTIGPQSTLPLLVWSMLRTGINPTINAISTLLIVTSAALLAIASRFTRINVEV